MMEKIHKKKKKLGNNESKKVKRFRKVGIILEILKIVK